MPYQIHTLGDLQQGLDKSLDPWLTDEKTWTKVEDVYLRRGIVHKRNGRSVFGQLGIKASGPDLASGSATYIGMLLNTPVIPRSVVFQTTGKVLRDDGNGGFIGNVGVGTNEIDYDLGLYEITFDGVTAADVTVNYHYENPVTSHVRGLKVYKRGTGTNELVAWDKTRMSKYDVSGGTSSSYFANVPASAVVLNISQAAEAVVTINSTAGWTTGDRVSFSSVVGMTEVNGNTYTITILGPTTFKLNGIDSTGFGAYVSGGIAIDIDYYTMWNVDNLMWATNFFERLYMVDFAASSRLRYYDGTSVFTPDIQVNASDTLVSALMLFEYHESLVALNTIEGAGLVNHKQRARWHRPPNPDAVNAWRDDIPGLGGYNDAPTDEEIIGAGFIKDNLIVQFTNGYWALIYTGNPVTRFIWKRITARGSTRSTFGTLSFESAISGIGLEGIQACDGNQMVNIDKKIPDFVYDIDIDNVKRCFSKNIDRLQQSWTAFPPAPASDYNAKVLVLNAGEQSYTIYNVPIDCLEVWYNTFDYTFGSYAGQTFGQLAGLTWGDQSFQSEFPWIVSGGDEGYVYHADDEDATQDATGWHTKQPFGFDIQTPKFNPYKAEGRKACLHWVKLYFKRQPFGKITVAFYVDDVFDPVLSKEIDLTQGSGTKSWYTIAVNHVANFHSIRIYLTDDQLQDPNNYNIQTEFHGAQFAFSPAGEFTI